MRQFKAEKVRRTYTAKVIAAPETVFPLLCPVREEEWVTGWEKGSYQLVYSESGYNEVGCIFRTRFLDGADSTWVCLNYDRERFETEFLIFVKDTMVRKMNIRLLRSEDGLSEMTLESTLTALSERGNKIVRNFTDEVMAKTAGGLAGMLNHYFETGTKMAVDRNLLSHLHH